MPAEIVIAPDSEVTLFFSVSLVSGELIDSNFEREPATCRIGDGNLLPGFEKRLIGLRAGEELEDTVPADEAFGQVNPANQHRMTRERFKRFLDDEFEDLQVGSVVSFRDAAGFDLPGVIKEKTAATVLVDFNHPLAGKDIVFRARIVRVREGDTQAIKVGFQADRNP